MDTEVIRVSINENEKIIELLKRMLDIKNRENKDVECEFDGKLLTTSNSNSIQELVVNNSNIIFEEFEKDRNSLLETSEMQKVIEMFDDRGVDEFDTKEEADLIEKQENEFDYKVKQLENLDFSQSINVYNWLNSLIQYVNNADLYIPLDREDYKYGSTANYIVKKLEDKGYTSQTNPVNNLDDYYRRLISYQLDDLTKYRFFAYDYADEIRENIETKEDDNLSELIILQTQKQLVLRNLTIVEDYEKGLFNSKKEESESFEVRKEKLQEKIQELQLTVDNDSDKIDINSEFLNAEDKLKSLAMRTGKEQTKAMNFYDAASGVPFTNNIIPALEQAAQLSDDDELKQPLIDALLKMDARYSSFKDDKDAQLVQDTLERLGIKPLTSSANTVEDEIMSLKNEIEALDKEQNARIERQKPIKEKLNAQLRDIDKKIEHETFKNKLAHIAEEGPISVDLERRLDKKDQWMELNTALALNKLNEQEAVLENKTEKITADNVEFEEDSFVPKEDSLTIPHPIKSIKKASITLIEKVRSIEFNKVVKNALDWIKEHKKNAAVVATGLMLGAGLLLNSELSNVEAQAIDNSIIESTQDNLQQDQDEIDSSLNNVQVSDTTTNVSTPINDLSTNEDSIQPVVSEQTDAKISQEVFQDVLYGILDGDKVYASANDAANNTNALSTNESHRNNSWSHAETGAFYDSNADVLTREEAEQKIAAGEQVVVRYDNNGIPIGYAVGQLSNDDASGLSR